MKQVVPGLRTGVGVLSACYALSSPAMAGGMPQLDFSNPLITGQVIWGAGIFFIFYMILSHVMLPRVGRIIGDRATYISAEAEKARSAKKAADDALAAQEASLNSARQDARSHIDKLLEKERQDSAMLRQREEGRIKQDIAEAEARIEKDRQEALREIHEVAADVTQEIVLHFTQLRPSREAVLKQVNTNT